MLFLLLLDSYIIITRIFVLMQDQLNFHKLLGCHCQSTVRKYSSAEPCFLSPEVVRTKDKTFGNNTEGYFLSTLAFLLTFYMKTVLCDFNR